MLVCSCRVSDSSNVTLILLALDDVCIPCLPAAAAAVVKVCCSGDYIVTMVVVLRSFFTCTS